MKIFKNEISKKTVKMFIGGVLVSMIGVTIWGIVLNNKEHEAEGEEIVEVLEIETGDELIEE